MTETTAHDVCELLDLFGSLGVHVWIDGGWAVDACLGHQTRRHSDLDIVLEARDLDTVTGALRSRGFGPAHRNDTRLWNFAMVDPADREVDLHAVVLDEEGRGIYGPPGDGKYYPAEALRGKGVIARRHVDCISPEWLVRFHTGYTLDAGDVADVTALCAKFDIPLPAEYRNHR